MPNYNPIARSYDFLSRIVFGRAQVNAQVALLHAIPAEADILLVGGGTGWILEEIAKFRPAGLRLVYVDNSSEMIALARKRHFGKNIVHFIENDMLTLKQTGQFDVVITPFLFDNFSQDLAQKAFCKMHDLLKPDGLWFYTDFCISKKASPLWQLILLRAMYLFFQVVAGVNAGKIPDMQLLFSQKHYKKNLRSTYYKGFIESIIYQKSSHRGAASPE